MWSLVYARWAGARIPAPRWTPVGSPHRCLRSTAAKSRGLIANGCPRTASTRRPPSAGVAIRIPSRITILRPWDLDYGRHIKFDHDFIGRAALEAKANTPHRRKVSLVWNDDDVIAVYGSLLGAGHQRQVHGDRPTAHYATFPYDKVVSDGRIVGVSTYPAYLAPDRVWVSLAVLDESHSAAGSAVRWLWGEKDGGSHRPVVERHVQKEIRATVTGWPFSKLARQGYRAAR